MQAKGAVSKVQNAIGDNAGLFDKKPSAQEVGSYLRAMCSAHDLVSAPADCCWCYLMERCTFVARLVVCRE